jgi:hypothetical protein
MSDKCIDQVSLEKLILSEFNNEDNSEIAAHLNSCSFCAQRYEDLKKFYKHFQSNLAYNSPPFPKNVRLKRINSYTLKLRKHKEKDHKLSMAAENGANSHLELLAVYSADDENLLLRLLKNRENGEYQLCLLAEDPIFYQYVMVYVEGFEEHFISDLNGNVFLGKITIRDARNIVFRVHTPDLVHTLNSREIVDTLAKQSEPKQLTLKKAVEGRYDINIKQSAERYDIDFCQTEGNEKLHELALGSEDKDVYRPSYVTEAAFGFTRIPLKKDFTLRLYLAGSAI